MAKLPKNYFPHDFNAKSDRKILRLRKVLGVEGYGIYWMLIETLSVEEDFSYPIADIDLLADDFGTSTQKVEAVIKQFDLFEIDKQAKFFSVSLIARLQKYLEISAKARQSATIRWDKARKSKELDAIALPSHSVRNANKIKEDNIKEKNTDIHPPEFSEFLSYAQELEIYNKSMKFQLEAKYDSWKESGWKDGNNKKIKNWKTKLRNTLPYFNKKGNYERLQKGAITPENIREFERYKTPT